MPLSIRHSVVGFVDADIAAARRAAEVWGGEAFNSVAAAFSPHKVDVAVVAPTSFITLTAYMGMKEEGRRRGALFKEGRYVDVL